MLMEDHPKGQDISASFSLCSDGTETGRVRPRGFRERCLQPAKASSLQPLNEKLSLSTQYASSLLELFSLSGHTFQYFFRVSLDMVSIQLSFLVLCPVCVWFELSWSFTVVLDAVYFPAIVLSFWFVILSFLTFHNTELICPLCLDLNFPPFLCCSCH